MSRNALDGENLVVGIERLLSVTLLLLAVCQLSLHNGHLILDLVLGHTVLRQH